eukprot:362965-Chlamydomonas_euryale.AAC.3
MHGLAPCAERQLHQLSTDGCLASAAHAPMHASRMHSLAHTQNVARTLQQHGHPQQPVMRPLAVGSRLGGTMVARCTAHQTRTTPPEHCGPRHPCKAASSVGCTSLASSRARARTVFIHLQSSHIHRVHTPTEFTYPQHGDTHGPGRCFCAYAWWPCGAQALATLPLWTATCTLPRDPPLQRQEHRRDAMNVRLVHQVLALSF